MQRHNWTKKMQACPTVHQTRAQLGGQILHSGLPGFMAICSKASGRKCSTPCEHSFRNVVLPRKRSTLLELLVLPMTVNIPLGAPAASAKGAHLRRSGSGVQNSVRGWMRRRSGLLQRLNGRIVWSVQSSVVGDWDPTTGLLAWRCAHQA